MRRPASSFKIHERADLQQLALHKRRRRTLQHAAAQRGAARQQLLERRPVAGRAGHLAAHAPIQCRRGRQIERRRHHLAVVVDDRLDGARLLVAEQRVGRHCGRLVVIDHGAHQCGADRLLFFDVEQLEQREEIARVLGREPMVDNHVERHVANALLAIGQAVAHQCDALRNAERTAWHSRAERVERGDANLDVHIGSALQQRLERRLGDGHSAERGTTHLGATVLGQHAHKAARDFVVDVGRILKTSQRFGSQCTNGSDTMKTMEK
jgi:hypothetical protein